MTETVDLLEDNAAPVMMSAAQPKEPHPSERMTGPRKAAILCLALGDDAAINIFKYLDEEEVQRITRELAGLHKITSETADTVVEEFHNLLLARSYVSTGGIEYAKRLLIKTFGGETAKRLIDKVVRTLESTAGFDALQKADPQQLSKIFQAEHPQTIAVVLSHLDASTAASTLQNLPEPFRADVIMRMAGLQSISQDVIRRISLVLEQKLNGVGNVRRMAVGGLRSVSEICNRLDRDISRKVLEEIEETSPDLSLEIRNLMVTFDDLLLIDDHGIREVLQRVDKKVLTLALKGTIPELQARFFSNMSARAVEMMKEEMDYMGQVKTKDVSNAQREIVDIMRDLDDQGVISLTSREEGGETYVS
jgi:flagellar motor switch protein FliG